MKQNQKTMTVGVECSCGTTELIGVNIEDAVTYSNDALIQHAFPYLTATQRESIIIKMCGTCVDILFNSFDDKPTTCDPNEPCNHCIELITKHDIDNAIDVDFERVFEKTLCMCCGIDQKNSQFWNNTGQCEPCHFDVCEMVRGHKNIESRPIDIAHDDLPF